MPLRIHLLAVGRRMPAWVESGFREYSRRLRGDVALELTEVTPARRSQRYDAERAREEESRALLGAIPQGAWVVALDERGEPWASADVARHMEQWALAVSDVVLLVGGPDGLHARCLEAARQRWSLSRLTLPHALVRVVAAEQVYRGWSLLNNHPYHRA